jgi:hypothetical protein
MDNVLDVVIVQITKKEVKRLLKIFVKYWRVISNTKSGYQLEGQVLPSLRLLSFMLLNKFVFGTGPFEPILLVGFIPFK